MNTEIRVDLTKLVEGMDDAKERLIASMVKGVGKGVRQAEAAAKANLKGDLRGKHLMSSIHYEVKADGALVTGKVGVGAATGIEGDAGEMFGIYVHEGTGIYSRTGMGRQNVPWSYRDDDGEWHITSGMTSNPFLENAYNAEKDNVQRLIAAELMAGE